MQSVQDDFVSKLSHYKVEVVAVNDGSRDATLETLLSLRKTYPYLKVIDFSRNFGKEAALSAGLKYCTCDAAVPIDADLQHPLSAVFEMIKLWEQGFEVVLAKRTDRKTDGFLQKLTAKLFYKVHNKMSDIEIPPDVGDFRLMDKKVINVLNELNENKRFMKGLFAWVGFNSTVINYEVLPRQRGSSKFNTWKLWNFALEGITSFSTAPLKIWTYIGALISLVSLIYAIYLIIKTTLFGSDLAGYPSIMVSVLFMGGIQLIGIGVLGEYIGRIYIESKNRPPYVVRAVY